MISPHIDEMKNYIKAIEDLPADVPLKREHLLGEKFLMQTDNSLSMYYAPHNETINTAARIVIVGITPGWSQMKVAFEAARQAMKEGASLEQTLLQAKRSAGFAGSMRRNLAEMLDGIGIATAFGLTSSAELFEERAELLHTTSIIKYPVFKDGKNYTGHTPKMDRVAMLEPYIERVFPEELSRIPGDCLIIPLGKAVAEMLRKLADQGKLHADRCLFGFPHPSGANGHRVSQFAAERERLGALVRRWSAAGNS